MNGVSSGAKRICEGETPARQSLYMMKQQELSHLNAVYPDVVVDGMRLLMTAGSPTWDPARHVPKQRIQLRVAGDSSGGGAPNGRGLRR